MTFFNRFLYAPPGATATENNNFRVAFIESAFIGFIAAGGTFLPVFLARLGASNLQVSLATALPNLVGVLLAIPLGGLIQSRRNIIPWYSRGRLGQQLGYTAIGLASFLLPLSLAIPGILGIWTIAMLFSTVTSVSFAVVMDATAGGRGRYELMSRRWSILGLMNAFSLVIVGQALGWLPFPTNYEVIFVLLGLLGLVSYRYSSAIRVPDHPPLHREPGAGRLAGYAELLRRVRGERAFLSFTSRHFVFVLATSIAVPLVPLFYVRVLGASDAWIGIIGTSQALALLVGYWLWRRVSRRAGSRAVVMFSTIGVALTPALLSLTHDVAVAAVIAATGAIFVAGVNLAMFDRMMSTVPAGYGVTFSSVDTGLVYFAGIIGPLVAATLADRVGIPTALAIAGFAGLMGALLFVVDALRNRTAKSAASAVPGAQSPATPAAVAAADKPTDGRKAPAG